MITQTEAYTKKFMAHNPTVLDTRVNSIKQVCTFFEHPTQGDSAFVYVMIGDILANTEFFELEDFYLGSDYEPHLINNEILCKFEYKEEDNFNKYSNNPDELKLYNHIGDSIEDAIRLGVIELRKFYGDNMLIYKTSIVDNKVTIEPIDTDKTYKTTYTVQKG